MDKPRTKGMETYAIMHVCQERKLQMDTFTISRFPKTRMATYVWNLASTDKRGKLQVKCNWQMNHWSTKDHRGKSSRINLVVHQEHFIRWPSYCLANFFCDSSASIDEDIAFIEFAVMEGAKPLAEVSLVSLPPKMQLFLKLVTFIYKTLMKEHQVADLKFAVLCKWVWMGWPTTSGWQQFSAVPGNVGNNFYWFKYKANVTLGWHENKVLKSIL